MKQSTAMRYVMVRAEAEAAALQSETTSMDHVFLGILKLSELTAEKISPSSSHKEETDQDIERISKRLKDNDVDSSSSRAILRKILKEEAHLASNARNELDKIMEAAAERSKAKGRERLAASDVLEELFDNPSAAIGKAILLVQMAQLLEKGVQDKGKDAKKQDPSHEDATDEEEKLTPEEMVEQGKEFLPTLTEHIKDMRYTLLNKVFGQDHAIHSFAEGMFSAEVLAQADEKRKRPRAIFVFAGPPGVGKTFLAEEAAEALDLPFKRFDMSGYSDHQQHINLVGFAPSYKDAKEGVLTGFVAENPHSILLFDEIEKAHLNTINLFLQMLDAGILHDDYLDKDIVFKDTIIIFTTNAGRQLYEGEEKQNAAGIPRHTILNALETDKHPQTGRPFFPAAICSRLATGWPLMFNHLQAHDLEKICASEIKRCGNLFEKGYGVSVDADGLLSTTLLFGEGGLVDARTLRAQAELFFKNEIFKLSKLYETEGFSRVMKNLESLRFEVEADDLPPEVVPLFKDPEKPQVLVFSDLITSTRIQDGASEFVIHKTDDKETALDIAGSHEIGFVLLDLAGAAEEGSPIDPEATWADLNQPPHAEGTLAAFDFAPISSQSIKRGRELFKELHERLPEVPVYLLESSSLSIDEELLTSFVRAGARGKLILPSYDLSVFVEDMQDIAEKMHLQKAAANLAAERKILYFDTAPKMSADEKSVTIRVRDLSIKRSPNADDASELLDDTEKPQVSFNDVIGATSAKDELKFFVDYLKNPKKFMAQGLKPPKGVLLYGPPGTGKTLLAKAMAGESDVAFIPAVASSFVTKYQGSGPESIRKLFERARRYAPSIVFIDEIDAIGRARGGRDSGHGEEMALNALLTEMDGFSVDPKRPVFVLAATNFEVEEGKGGMGTIDAALARRFDRRILVDLPDKEDRLKYLNMMLAKRSGHTVSEHMIEQLAKRSTGLSLASLESIIEMATRTAVKQNTVLNDEILEESFEVTRHGDKKDWGEEYMQRVARHESGHAFMCYLTGSTPAYLTIVARGGHGGYMEHDSDESSPLKTKEELLGRIRTALGGRAAEIAYYGEKEGVSSGASGDLEQATRIVRAMICSYGMDEEIGLAALSAEEATTGPMAERITMRISAIIKEELDHTVKEITEAKPRIDKMVDKLLEKNKLDKHEIEELLA